MKSCRSILALLLAPFALSGAPQFHADFNDGKVPPPLFERFPEMRAQDGALFVKQAKRHAASPTLPIQFNHGTLRFRFQFKDAQRLVCRFEDKSRVKNASAHLCRLEITRTNLNLKLDSPPKDRDHRAAAVFAAQSANLADGNWHQVEIRFSNDKFSAQVDDLPALKGAHPHLAGRKIGTFFVINKGSLLLDDIRLETSGDREQSLAIFHDYIEPLFIRHCYKCHSHEAKKAKGGLVVDSLNPMLQGGDLGPALIPGDPEKSLIYQAATYHDADLQMPPDGKLDELQIEKLRQWIALGAAHPRTGPAMVKDSYTGPKAEDLWSVQPLNVTAPPGKASNPIDAFWADALAKKGLKPSPTAEPSAILRRLHYVLTGLPPTPGETRAFLKQAKQNPDAAITRKVDRLLASPRFGERWGRHWLDVARYADVSGSTSPAPYPEAWRYRQWAIHAFNTDKPWHDFVREQLAGDLLTADNPKRKTEQLIATGYLALPHVLAVDRDKERLKLDTIDEQLDVIGRTFLGVQIGCARCHDHKIDPFPTREYYAMAGIMRSTDAIKASNSQEAVEPAGVELKAGNDSLPFWMRGGKGAKIHSTRDAARPRNEPIHLRGEQDMLGEVVPRGFPSLIQVANTRAIPRNASGRLQLAEWLLDEDNVLAARVIVNRVWHHVFGQGIVRTTDNFGLTGDPPSHPELLDFLAARFRQHHHHSFKSLIRELLLTQAFRQSSRARDDGLAIDPQNRFLWRANLRRGDAESLIDSIQWVSRTLDLKPTAGTVPKFKRGNQASTSDLPIPAATLRKRAIYWPVFRKDVPIAMDVLSIFDFPPATVPRGNRATTRVPAQALALLNSTVVLDAARKLRSTLPDADDKQRLEALYERTLARAPSAEEIEAALAFLDTFTADLKDAKSAKPEKARNVAWNRLCHTMLACNEFITIP